MIQHFRLRTALLLAMLMALAAPLPAARNAGFDAAHRVTFRSGATPVDKLNFNAPHDQIAGYLYKPAGEGPFAAVVLGPDLFGPRSLEWVWAQRLVKWGYAVLAVDVYSRDTAKSSIVTVAHDAYGALKYMAALPYVDARRVAWIGWSHRGGQAIMSSGALEAGPNNPRQPSTLFVSEGAWRFQAAIAYYPECPGVQKAYYAPVLMLLGGKDLRQLDECVATAKSSTAGGKVMRYKVYREATDLFDVQGVDRDLWGQRVRFDPQAAEDTVVQVKAFLAEYLAPTAGR